MCYAYIINDYASIVDRYNIKFVNENVKLLRELQTIRPTAYAPIVTIDNESKRNLSLMKFGLIPSWSHDPKIGVKMCNARVETVNSKPSYKVPFQKRRCIVPTVGFYESLKENGKSYPKLFESDKDKIFSLAGISDNWIDEKNKPLNSFSILTTSANKVVEKVHDRMPLILPKEYEDDWIGKEKISENDLKDLVNFNLQKVILSNPH